MGDHEKRVVCRFLSELFVCLLLAFVRATDTETSPNVIIALTGDNAILPCSMIPTERAGLVVEWSRSDQIDMIVHINRDGRDLDDQNLYYRGRTTMFLGEMKNGNISLKLTNLKILDSGYYSCYVPSLDSVQKTVIQLLVGAVSQPVISILGPKDDGVVLKCESGGWYPEPNMTWLDSDGSILPDGPTETQTDSEGRYTVRGQVTIQKTDNNKVICMVNQQQINLSMEIQINVPDEAFAKSHGGLIAGLFIAVLVAVVAGGVGVFMWRKKKLLKRQLENMDAAEFVDKHREKIIDIVNHEMALVIAEDLNQRGLITQKVVTEIRNTPFKRTTELYKALDSGGLKVKSAFYKSLLECSQHNSKLKKLSKQNLKELEKLKKKVKELDPEQFVKLSPGSGSESKNT
ncbi:hypothetical protein UPYG_G00246590 [Umbra pygmaea]|uniref:Ig-like domain-containing protein n=1 Tax=Umbra pygmaea TaxID=75934 RepID=A0ABD0X2J7_UMBPY